MFDKDEFRKYAIKHRGINSATYDKYVSIHNDYISPTVIEERQMNVASMDIFSRLMMDRIIFLGVGITIMFQTSLWDNCFFLNLLTLKKTFKFT